MLKDAAFWSTVIALLALILSQLPPLRELLKHRELRIVVPETVSLYHFMGNLQISGFLALHNVGGRSITVQKVECVLLDDDGHPLRLPAQTYWSRAQAASGQELFIGWIHLSPSEHWAESVHFYKVWSVQDEEDSAKIVTSIRDDITAKRAAATTYLPNSPDADDKLAKDAKDFFEKHFNLTKGNYRLLIAAISEKTDVVAVRGFDFTLYDHHIRALRSVADDYKTGAGIYYPVSDPYKSSVSPRLRPMQDDEAQRSYAKLATADLA